MQTDISTIEPPLRFVEKLRVALACGLAMLLLGTVGWQLAHPRDSQMALTLARNGASVLAVWPALAILAAISAAIGTAVIGRRLPEGGALAAALGLAVMALRGGTMEALLAYDAGTTPETRQSLMTSLTLDLVLWTGVMAAAWVSMVLVRGWLWGMWRASTAVVEPVAAAPAGGKPVAKAGKTEAAGTPASIQPLCFAALAITIVVALIVIWNTISRTPVAAVQRNQVVASVTGGLFLGALAARYVTGVTEPLWYACAAPIVGLVAFIMGHLSSDMSWAQNTIYQPYIQLATTPPHDLVRALPVLYVTLGVVGALWGYWTADRMERLALLEAE